MLGLGHSPVAEHLRVCQEGASTRSSFECFGPLFYGRSREGEFND